MKNYVITTLFVSTLLLLVTFLGQRSKIEEVSRLHLENGALLKQVKDLQSELRVAQQEKKIATEEWHFAEDALHREKARNKELEEDRKKMTDTLLAIPDEEDLARTLRGLSVVEESIFGDTLITLQEITNLGITEVRGSKSTDVSYKVLFTFKSQDRKGQASARLLFRRDTPKDPWDLDTFKIGIEP